MKNNDYFMNIAIKEAMKCKKTDDVPIGCVIVYNNKVISKAHNIKNYTKKITDHAEIIAITKINKKNKNWHLFDYKIYVTMEPCIMCAGAIISSHISEVYYCIPNHKMGSKNILGNKLIILDNNNIHKNILIKLMQNFFKEKRNKKE